MCVCVCVCVYVCVCVHVRMCVCVSVYARRFYVGEATVPVVPSTSTDMQDILAANVGELIYCGLRYRESGES